MKENKGVAWGKVFMAVLIAGFSFYGGYCIGHSDSMVFTNWLYNVWSGVAYDDADGVVYLYEDDIIFLNRMYSTYTNEFGVCMKKQVVGDKLSFIISDTYITNYDRGQISISCIDNDDFAILHSHPNGACMFSDTDIDVFMSSSREYNFLVCGTNAIVIVDRDDNQYDYEVVANE